ncbi:MAG: hypothetical protein AAGA55_10030 [Planctomycetota bacterium]
MAHFDGCAAFAIDQVGGVAVEALAADGATVASKRNVTSEASVWAPAMSRARQAIAGRVYGCNKPSGFAAYHDRMIRQRAI